MILKSHGRSFWVYDNNLDKLYPELMSNKSLRNSHSIITSEKSKRMGEVLRIVDHLQKMNFSRKDTMIVLGGGITTDLAGLAASMFKRGCNLIFIPTTLVAMIDASIGGKTGVNCKTEKNLLGTFYPAHYVYICTEFLKSLSADELLNGWAEIVKLGILSDNEITDLLPLRPEEPSRELIEKCISVKMEICQRDLHDEGERRLLNLGHTYAHIFESLSGFRIPHGRAVAYGLQMAVRESHFRGLIDQETYQNLLGVLDFLKIDLRISGTLKQKIAQRGLACLTQDKKNSAKVRMVLFNGWKSTEVYEIENPAKIIENVLGWMG